MAKMDWDKQRHLKPHSYIDSMPSTGKKVQYDMKRMKAMRTGTCLVCEQKINKGTLIKYYFKYKVAIHAGCDIGAFKFRPTLP
jgi:hypothetical protein